MSSVDIRWKLENMVAQTYLYDIMKVDHLQQTAKTNSKEHV